MKKHHVIACPNCKSTDIERDWSNPVVGVPTVYACNNCGHTAYQVIEVPAKEASKLPKKHTRSESEKVDTAYGKFEVRFWWKIAGPATLILGAITTFHEPIFGAILLILGVFFTYVTYVKKRRLRA